MAQVPGRDSWLLLAGMIQVNLVDVDVRSNTTSSISSTNKKSYHCHFLVMMSKEVLTVLWATLAYYYYAEGMFGNACFHRLLVVV
jgi:hypothetical protein